MFFFGTLHRRLHRLLRKRRRKAFTLVESLLVIAIIAILATIIIVAVNPARQFAQVRNTQRQSDTKTLLEAVQQYTIDNNGVVPTGLDGTLRMFGTAASGCDVSCGSDTTASACLDLSSEIGGTYVSVIPYDPSTGSDERTYYAVQTQGTGRLKTVSCSAELGEDIGHIR